MRNKSRYILSFLIGLAVLFVSLGFVTAPKTEGTEPPFITMPTISASATTSSDIFSEVTEDGLASYLKIELKESYITDIKITQTIGDISYIPTKDELGTTCYYQNSSSIGSNLVFYFTRPAIYTVQYITKNENIQNETYIFNPTLNESEIQDLYTSPDDGQTRNSITIASDNYYFLHSGKPSLSTDSLGLYSIDAIYKDTSTPSLLTEIPDNAYGKIDYKIKSVNGNNTLDFEVYVLTTKFDIEFSDTDNLPLNKLDHFHNDGYVFNSAINYEITTANDSVNLSNVALSNNDKIELVSHLKFSINEQIRNDTNSAFVDSINTEIEIEEGQSNIVGSFEVKDHSIFTFVTQIKNATSNNTLVNGLNKIKIITKVPKNQSGNYAFSLVLEQVANSATNNYIDGVLNGYIDSNTIIYYPTAAIRLFYNGYSAGYTESATALRYSDGTTSGSIGQNPASVDFSSNGSNITLDNNTSSFDDYFNFSFIIKTYSHNAEFKDILAGHMFYNNTHEITDDFANVENTLSSPINFFSYFVPNNYENDCIPMHLRVTYNGTSFNDIYNMKSGDEIKISNPGTYTVEFYNLPSYNFLISNLPTNLLSQTRYYYKLNFVISGPSIYASTTDFNGKPLTLSNNLYTQHPASVKVDLPSNYTFIVYHNGNQYSDVQTTSLAFDLSSAGTWKTVIFNEAGNEVQSLSFTIADTIYQGFTINKNNEYENLAVSTKVSSKPEVYEKMENKNAYHLTASGSYKIDIDAREYFRFQVKVAGSTSFSNENTYTINSNTLKIDITKSYFSMYFSGGANGSRTSEKIILNSVSGVQLQSLEVFRNGKSVKVFTADQLEDITTVTETGRTFSDNGTYTFKLTDKFGNTYEAQIEKYYKVNVALIFLILIGIVMTIVMIVVIIKARHKIKVK